MKTRLSLVLVLVACGSVLVMPRHLSAQIAGVSTEARAKAVGFGFAYRSSGGIDRVAPRKLRSTNFPVVEEVAAASPAEAAGVRVGDQIVSVNGEDARLLPWPKAEHGKSVVLRIRRGDREREIRYVIP
jgi:C-terminal processing protease CtpA/Prc